MDEMNALTMRLDQMLLSLIRDKFCDGVTAELARRIGKDPSYVSRLFYPTGKNGAKGIGLEVMKACDSAFSLPPGYWYMGFGEAVAALHFASHTALPEDAAPSARALVEQLAALARPHRPTLRKNLAALLGDVLEHPEDLDLVEQTIADIRRFYD